MASNETPLTRGEFVSFAKDLTDQLNKVFAYTFKRFDSLEERLIRVENQLSTVQDHVSSVKKDTEIIPKIFEVLETDGEDIARMKLRLELLEDPPKA